MKHDWLANGELISNPDLTLFDAEMWDLGKFDTMPFFIGYYKKGCRDNTLTVIGSFYESHLFRGKIVVNMAHGGIAKVAVRYFLK